MSKKCIYCRTKDESLFRGREHVIPRSFGTFAHLTPTLHSVCDGCNSAFKLDLDQGLARDTLEGVTRYKKGILSRENQKPNSIKFQLDESEQNGDYAGALLGGYDPVTGKPLPLISQFWIHNIQTGEFEKYTLEEIPGIEITEEKYGSKEPGNRQMRVMAPSKEEYDAVIETLAANNIPFKEKEMLAPPPFLEGASENDEIMISGHITGTIDKNKKRAFAKILFNFAAYYIGDDEVLKSEWDTVRDFVRNDGETLLGRLTQEPFWTGQETEEVRFQDDSYNLRIENKDGNVVGIVQMFNLFTIEFILVEGYQLAPEQEVSYRFTPGQVPVAGVKMNVNSNKYE